MIGKEAAKFQNWCSLSLHSTQLRRWPLLVADLHLWPPRYRGHVPVPTWAQGNPPELPRALANWRGFQYDLQWSWQKQPESGPGDDGPISKMDQWHELERATAAWKAIHPEQWIQQPHSSSAKSVLFGGVGGSIPGLSATKLGHPRLRSLPIDSWPAWCEAGKTEIPFRSVLTKLDGFQEAVAAAWTAVPAGPCPLLTLAAKLKATARGLQGWSEKKVGHVSS
jgi:hypothetical protein